MNDDHPANFTFKPLPTFEAEMASPLLLFTLAGAVAAAVYKFILFPAFFSPLSKIPNAHWSSAISPIWLLWMKWTRQENLKVYQAHVSKGSTVRLAPNTLSVNSFEDGLKTIYQGGFPKPDFYWHGFAVYGKPNLFTIKDNTTHLAHKRIFSPSFSKSSILASKSALCSVKEALFRRGLPILHKAAQNREPVEMIEFNYSYYLDTFVQWQFGRTLRSNLIEDEKERRMYLDGFFGLAGFTFWQYYFPKFAAFLRKFAIHLIPKWVDEGFAKVEDWNLDKCDRAHRLLLSGEPLAAEDNPAVFEQAMKSMSQIQSKPGQYPSRLEVASDMFSLNSGAFETSGNTTAYLFWEMSRHPEWQEKLRRELLGTSKPPKFGPDRINMDLEDMINPRDLDEMPILHAIVLESLRLWPSVPGGQPRVTPKTCTLGDHPGIPAGTVVQSYASVLHHTPTIFPDPWEWKPERWLQSDPQQLAQMKRWFWGFGSGGRGCLGIHFAYYCKSAAGIRPPIREEEPADLSSTYSHQVLGSRRIYQLRD